MKVGKNQRRKGKPEKRAVPLDPALGTVMQRPVWSTSNAGSCRIELVKLVGETSTAATYRTI